MSPTPVEAALERVRERTRYDVTILAARDLGSRAWNLADEESDRDVAIVFGQDPSAYATLGEYVEAIHDAGATDCRAWNVRRFAELLVESNPTVFEFLHSPLRYRRFGPLARLERDVGGSFEPIALYYHYRSLAERQYRTYLHGRLLEDGDPAFLIERERDGGYLVRPVADDESDPHWVERGVFEEERTDRTVKRTLYVARGVLYARYVRETHRFPTLDFPAFLDAEGDRFDASFIARTRDLVERKRAGDGDALVGRVFDPGEVTLPDVDPDRHATGGVDVERVNAFVRESLEAVADDNGAF